MNTENRDEQNALHFFIDCCLREAHEGELERLNKWKIAHTREDIDAAFMAQRAAKAKIGAALQGANSAPRPATPREQLEKRVYALADDQKRHERMLELLTKHPEFEDLIEILNLNARLGIF
ncbi:MAG: hypothetical protein WBQ94_03725 [Terracidiphilus sp.]